MPYVWMSALPLTCFALILTELVHEHSVYVYHKLIYVRACDGTPACRVDGPQSWLTELLACLLACLLWADRERGWAPSPKSSLQILRSSGSSLAGHTANTANHDSHLLLTCARTRENDNEREKVTAQPQVHDSLFNLVTSDSCLEWELEWAPVPSSPAA